MTFLDFSIILGVPHECPVNLNMYTEHRNMFHVQNNIFFLYYREEESSLLQHVNGLMTVFSDSCHELVLQYSPWEHYSVCCQRNSTPSKTKTTLTQNAEDHNEEFESVSKFFIDFVMFLGIGE